MIVVLLLCPTDVVWMRGKCMRGDSITGHSLCETSRNSKLANVNKKSFESLCETMDQHIYWTCVSLVITHPLFKCIASPSFFSFGLSGRQGSVHLQRSAVGCQAKRWWSPNKQRNAVCLQLRWVNRCQLGHMWDIPGLVKVYIANWKDPPIFNG